MRGETVPAFEKLVIVWAFEGKGCSRFDHSEGRFRESEGMKSMSFVLECLLFCKE